MLISEFARATGLTPDTVRFYVRLGLLQPETNGKGGRNPYQIFTDEHVRTARVIRMAQIMGMSLKEIGAIGDELRDRGISDERSIEIMNAQLLRIEERLAELNHMAGYLRAKVSWLKSERQGPEPELTLHGENEFDGTCG